MEARVSGQLEFGEEDPSPPLERIWELCLHLLATKLSQVTFESFVRPIQMLSCEENVVTLGVANPYALQWVERKASDAIRRALEFHLDTSGLQLRFIVLSRDQQTEAIRNKTESARKRGSAALQPALPLEEAEEAAPASLSVPPTASAAAPMRATTKEERRSRPINRKAESKPNEPDTLPIPTMPLNDRYTFETFLVGRSNRLAHAGATSVAARPGAAYNPLFLYGGPGLGKSHLLQGIAHVLRKTHPHLRVAFISGEFFAQRYIAALRDHATEDFRRQYRQIDVWLVDDIQFIAGKEHTKEEFFHTFNSLYQGGKQVVFASDRSPRELNTMDERLRSRFQSGLIADIGAPDLETRIAILEQACKRENASVPDNVLTYIASAIQSNIRALEGALIKLVAVSSVTGQAVSPEMAQSVLSEYFIEKPIRYRKPTIAEIVAAVAGQFGVTSETLKGPGRNKDVSLARHVAMYLCRELLPEENLRMVGAAFGGRDHATVVYACQKLILLMEADTDLKNLVQTLTRTLSSPE